MIYKKLYYTKLSTVSTGLQYVSGIGSGSSLHNSGTACVESNSGGSSRNITIRGTGIINAYGGSDSPGIGGENSCITILEGININAYWRKKYC